MGGSGIVLSHESNADARREIWEHCYAAMQARAKKKATKDVVNYYVMFQTDDWNDDDLAFHFADAAGLCVGEMYAALHWLEVIVRAEWPALERIAKTHGVTITKPERSADPIFFISGSKLGYAHKGGDELWFFPADGGAKRVAPDKVPKADRERLRGLIASGTCACELCQPDQPKVLRAPKKPPKPPPPAPVVEADLATATVKYGWHLDELKKDPARVIALECGGGPKSPPLIRALPSFPLRALGLRGYTTRAVLPEISQLKHLEVLSLNATELKQPIGDALSPLVHLRALDLDGVFNARAHEGSFWDLPQLELVEPGNWDHYADQMKRVRRLRHLIATDDLDAKAFADRPIESLRWFRPVDAGVLKRWPLRFVEVGDNLSLPPRDDVRFVDVGGNVPEWLRELPNLTGLSVRSADGLPDWLTKMPKLQVLQIAHSKALAERPEKFKVLEKLKHLRVLILAPDGGTSVPFDLSALRELEYLSVTWAKEREEEDFVKGFEHVKKVFFSTEWARTKDEAFTEKYPCAERDGNVFRMWPLLTIYRWLLGPSDPAHWLARFATSTQWPTPPTLQV